MATTIGDPTRPEFVRDEHLDHLDELFESYAVNPGCASHMPCSVFRVGEAEALAIFEFWLNTFGRRFTQS